MTTTKLRVQGLDCADEAAELRQTVGALTGIRELTFDYLRSIMVVDYDESIVSLAKVLEAVEAAGMRAEPLQDATLKTGGNSDDGRWRRSLLTIGSGLWIALAFACDWWALGWHGAFGFNEAGQSFTAQILYVIAALLGSLIVLPKAWAAVRRGRLEINVLMVIAVTGAIAIGEVAEAATVSFLFTVSLALEAWSVDRARRAVESLMLLTPESACVLQSDGTESVVPASEVEIGAVLVVRPGEKFPLDGKVQRGETSVDQAPITGESIPVSKRPGDDVFAGTINQDGAIEVVTTKPADDSTIARIIRLVSDAQRKRSEAEQWVETFARYYTPAVMALAVAVMLLPPLVAGGSWVGWFYQGLVLLVIACPCALVISTPVSMVAALASAANQGVLVKGASFLEAAAGLKAIALDKTGTLTEGRPEVKEVMPLSGHTDRELLDIASAIEARSQHPLAAAIVRHAQSIGLVPAPAEDFQAISGKGATALLNGERYWIGSHRAFEERGQETPELHDQMQKLAERGLSIVVIANDEHVCGLIALGDKVRDNAKQALMALRRAGINRIVMLTGDNPSAAASVALAVGVDDVRAELLPEDKVAAIEQLVAEQGRVGMIGDGVNDAPAMARATLGIAMGAIGTDAALETADVALMSDDLSRIAWLIKHAQRTLKIVRQNISASLGVKAVFVILTALGHANLWSAIAADMGVTLIVVLNSLRLLGK